MDPLSEIALRRLRLVAARDEGVTKKKELAFRGELAAMGYRLEGYDDSVLVHHQWLMRELQKLRGGQVKYVPLFQGFPEKIPEDQSYFVDRLLGYLGNACPLWEEGRRLEDGTIVPEWLFDLEEFGANPITQLQDKGLFKAGVERQKGRKQDTHTEWLTLRAVPPEEIESACLEFLRSNLYAASSIKEALHEDLNFLLEHFGADSIEPERVVFKETRTLLMTYYWNQPDYQALARYCDTPTDLLRLFAGLTGSDVSLTEKIKFPKLSRPQRRFVLFQLEQCGGLAEDLNRYRGLWLAVARYLHPGQYHQRFPKTAAAFRRLCQGRVPTFNTRVEGAFEKRDLKGALELVRGRPGLLGRRLHQLLELAGEEYPLVLDAFAAVSMKLALKNLLMLETHFRTIEDSEYRAIFTQRGSLWVGRNRRGRVAPEALGPLSELIQKAVRQQLSRRASWEGRKVYLDPAWRDLTVPLQQRKASEGLLTLGRGSRLPLDDGKVLRLFVYWKDGLVETDLDLSAIKFDENLNYLDHVSYTQLSSGGAVHSGDLQSAPHGAAEFIDLDILHFLEEPACRYIASLVYRYRGDLFANLECHAGWMVREKIDSNYKSFDIKTVQQKFDLNGGSSSCIPVVVDLYENRVIFTDLYLWSVEGGNTVEGGVNDVSTLVRQMVRMRDTRPNMFELARHHAVARGAELVNCASEADLVFGFEGADYDATDVAGVLSGLI